MHPYASPTLGLQETFGRLSCSDPLTLAASVPLGRGWTHWSHQVPSSANVYEICATRRPRLHVGGSARDEPAGRPGRAPPPLLGDGHTEAKQRPGGGRAAPAPGAQGARLGAPTSPAAPGRAQARGAAGRRTPSTRPCPAPLTCPAPPPPPQDVPGGVSAPGAARPPPPQPPPLTGLPS